MISAFRKAGMKWGDPMNTQDFKRKLTAVFSADVAGLPVKPSIAV